MTNIATFPLTRESRARFALRGDGWAVEADKRLAAYSGWLFPEGPPGWLGDEWWRTIVAYRRHNPAIDPNTANWPALWSNFIDGLDDERRDTWQRAVTVSMREIEGDAA